MYSFIETIRESVFEHLFSNQSFLKPWQNWSQQIVNALGRPIAADHAIGLGDQLHDIFKSTAVSGREQAMLSGGGNAWESLVCWYLNFCLQGSRSIVFKHSKKLIPSAVLNSTSVNYGSFASNSESDLIAIILPNTNRLQSLENTSDAIAALNELAIDQINDFEIGIIQCKTNWNDNAQVPMLWDLVYAAKDFENLNVTIGNSGFSIKEVKKFTYSFVTVPTTKGPFKPDSVRIQRVKNLTGGNYWGLPSKQGVASSLKEIFQKNFSSGFDAGFRQDLSKAIEASHLNVGLPSIDTN